MSKAVDMKTLGFRWNPFRLIPAESTEIWAGRPELRKRIQMIMERSLVVSPSRMYLIWGDWGGGKTHSLRFFAGEVGAKGGLPVYFELPKAAKTTFYDVYSEFVKNIGQARLKKASEKLYSHFERIADSKLGSMSRLDASRILDQLPIQGRQLLKKTEKDEERSRMGMIIDQLNRFFDERTDFALAVHYLAKGTDDESWAAWGWISGIEEGKAIGIQASVESANLQSIWGLIVRMLTFEELEGEKPPYKAVFCFIDEFEDIEEMDTKSRLSITNGLKAAFNHSPERFCLLLSMSVPVQEEVEVRIGESLLSRISKPLIQTTPLDKRETKNFIKDLLNQSRDPDFKAPEAFYPFTEDAVDEVINEIEEQEGKITPRSILAYCGTVVEMAVLSRTFESGTKARIPPSFVEKALEPI